MGKDDGSRSRDSLGYDRVSFQDRPIDGRSVTSEDGRTMNYRLLADDGVWAQAGDELKRLDPGRYLAILAVVQDIIAIHLDPIGAQRQATGNFVFAKTKPDSDPD